MSGRPRNVDDLLADLAEELRVEPSVGFEAGVHRRIDETRASRALWRWAAAAAATAVVAAPLAAGLTRSARPVPPATAVTGEAVATERIEQAPGGPAAGPLRVRQTRPRPGRAASMPVIIPRGQPVIVPGGQEERLLQLAGAVERGLVTFSPAPAVADGALEVPALDVPALAEAGPIRVASISD